MSGSWEIETFVSPAGILADGSEQLLVGVQIVDLDNPDPAAIAFIDLSSTQARQIALGILTAADDADWQTEQDGCPEPAQFSAPDRAVSSVPCTRAVPARARALAARLGELFETDQQIVARLNHAHHLLAAANDRLRTAPAPDLVRVHEQIRLAFCAYQHESEQRRQLAVDVGELSARLTDTLTNAGYHPQHAREANVHELAAGTWQPTDKEKQR